MNKEVSTATAEKQKLENMIQLMIKKEVISLTEEQNYITCLGRIQELKNLEKV